MITGAAPHAAQVLRFRALLEEVMGLRFDDGATVHLQLVLARRLTVLGRTADEYLDDLSVGPRSEISALAPELTTGETYFLRHVEQFDALTRTVAPELLRTPGRSGPLRLLSAGCSTGEEAYSLAIAMRESALGAPVQILGVDVNPASIARALAARYSDWSLRAVPPNVRRRWFGTDGDDIVLDPVLREAVTFELHNFAAEGAGLWVPGSLDVIFCRNVIMYFTPEVMASVVARMAQALVPGGYLFLGSAETLRGLSTEFELCESEGTFYYRRRGAAAPTSGRVVAGARPAPAPGAGRPPSLIVRSKPERTGTEPPAGPRNQPGNQPRNQPRNQPGNPPGRSERLEVVLDLLGRERFADALAAMDDIGEPPEPDPEVLLLRAALLTHSGRLPAAEQACQQLLEVDRRSAGAHVLLAICREGEQDLPAAVDHCRTAISFDPEFAMPHVHLGRLAGRMGDRGTASRQYAQSAQLLTAETGRRILLFGGGFDREALISLCREGAAAGVPGDSR